jgi:hypothetical protein
MLASQNGMAAWPAGKSSDFAVELYSGLRPIKHAIVFG